MKNSYVSLIVRATRSGPAPSNADAWRGHGRVFVGITCSSEGLLGGCCGADMWGPGWGWDPLCTVQAAFEWTPVEVANGRDVVASTIV